MKRRDFVFKLFSASATICLFPQAAFSKQRVKDIYIGEINIHHRHGQLDVEKKTQTKSLFP